MNEIEMNITDAQYQQDYNGDNVAINFTIDGVQMSVPINSEGNRHYDEIMRQVDAGELTIADAE